MAMRVSHLVAMLGVVAALLAGSFAVDVSPRGIGVQLTHVCSTYEAQHLGDSRDVWVIYGAHDTAYVNDVPMTWKAARQAVATEMATRWEAVVWLSGDEALAYGDVVREMGHLQADRMRYFQTDGSDLNLRLSTSSQELARAANWRRYRASKGGWPVPMCVSQTAPGS